MGIPSYFSYIVKNHPEIIKKLSTSNLNIHNLYLDCNSIIYDVVYSSNDISDEEIIKKVISKIEEYISIINPIYSIFIAFDGVAPIAKLDQQRERRYKSQIIKKINQNIRNENNNTWNTSAITPGTPFMNKLDNIFTEYFKDPSIYNIKKIILSTPSDAGEGEHKIFKYIRDNKNIHSEQNTIIYGLDADLIMLSINHLPISNNIYLFRETPEFIKSIDNSLEPNQNYILDIPNLAHKIILEMNNTNEINNVQEKNIIYDYIFLCFFLGNDFMPHFPALNIRTGGIDKLINAYKNTIGKSSQNITDGTKIYWKNLHKIISFLESSEQQYIIDDDKLRNKREKRFYPINTNEQKITKFDAIPSYERNMEKYINPHKSGWKERYYKILFDIDVDEERLKQICINYLEGLEWTMKYYTIDCPDWSWAYKYHYPPLLQDLLKYIPYFDTTFIKPNNNEPVSSIIQLCYVLPKKSLDFLPNNIHTYLTNNLSHLYPDDCELIWSYNKYFWESHTSLPKIDINELKKSIQNIYI